MNLNDLLVSYKQVERPSYLDYVDETIQPIENSFENNTQQAYDRIAERQKKEGFMGWTLPTPENVDNNNNSMTSNDIVNFFINKGLTANQAKGIYGNLMQESAGKLNAVSRDGYNSYGLAQWTGSRKTKLFNKYGNSPTQQQQLEYLWEELNSTEKGALQALRNSKTVEEATEAFMNKFERPNAKYANLRNRIKYAKSLG